MIEALYTAASGMSAQQMNLDTIANNLANSSTTGFRQLRLQFQDMIYQNLVTPGAAESQSTVSAGLQIGLGTKPAATEVINTQGALNETNNPLDVAIEGAGFFQIQRPDGTIAYTRAGQFHLNQQGTLVTTDGDPLLPNITVPPNATSITITQYGVVNATLPGQHPVRQHIHHLGAEGRHEAGICGALPLRRQPGRGALPKQVLQIVGGLQGPEQRCQA